MVKKEGRKNRILLIAPLGSGKSATNIVGGNRLMAAESIHELTPRGFEVDVLDTSGSVTNLSPWKILFIRLTRFFLVLWSVVKNIRRFDVVFLLIAPYSALVLATSIWVICKIARRPMVLRLSGSSFGEVYSSYGAVARWLADRTYMRCALIYVETLQTSQEFSNLANVHWFPNTRNVESPAVVRRDRVSKLIFAGRLERKKGLAEALEACRHLPEHCHLQVFGPPMSNTDFSLFEGHPRATYGGVLEPAEVPRVLSEHDLLLFPSYFSTEGYPGIILEAFQCGVPVVAARCGGVPEVVEHERSGLLVEQRSPSALQSAIDRLLDNPALYQRLRHGAQRRGEYFRSPNWYGQMASDLSGLCRKTNSTWRSNPYSSRPV